MNRTDIINSLIKTFGYRTYLEIGTQEGKNYDQIKCKDKTGVDPCLQDKWNPDLKFKTTYIMTSDRFFKQNNKKYDIIFIDGDHNAEQVYRDVFHSLIYLKNGGTIVLHDCNPISELRQIVPRSAKQWNGDVWKTWVKLRTLTKNFSMFVVDTDEGIGIIAPGSQQPLQLREKLTYKNLEINRKKWLNLRDEKYFEQWVKDCTIL